MVSIPTDDKNPITAPDLIDMLRTALSRVEESEKLSPSDPALAELKTSLLLAVGEIELKKIEEALV